MCKAQVDPKNMSGPHVVFFNRSFYPDTSATGQLLTELCETLVETYGYRVTVVTGLASASDKQNRKREAFRLFSREEHRGIQIIRVRGTRFPKTTFAGRFSNYISYFFSAIYGSQFVDRPDAVVSLTDPPIIGLAAFLLSVRHGAPLVMSYRDIFPEVGDLLEDFHSTLVSSALLRVNCFLVRKSARVVALGETMRKRLITTKGSAPEVTIVIPDWADCNGIVPASKDNDFTRKHGLTGKFVVLHSGNIGLSQGLENVVRAAAILEDRREIQFVFVGDGIKRPQLEQLAKELKLESVRFIPFQPKSDLTLSFAAADVFVISLKKGLSGFIVPSKVYGILASGRPFVGAVEADSEVATIINQYKCGVTAAPEDPRDIAARILSIYDDPVLKEQMGERARIAGLAFDRAPQVLAYHRMFSEIVSESQQPRIQGMLKRGFDILLAGAGLLGSLPLWLLISIAIKLNDGGPVFYGHSRVGRYGRYFKGWKFRSMIPDADRKYGPLQASENDPRVTQVGRWLRATAMDELPQLWNIFCGDMSFVGPRALLPQEAELRKPGEVTALGQIPGFFIRTQVRPGLTGIAQVYAPRDIARRHKFRLDALYVKRQTFGLDLRLIALSFWISFRGKWEYRGEKL
jgi:lipopolysaccharide/colanic/teichoic acid biosynthesis glycosyltransferase